LRKENFASFATSLFFSSGIGIPGWLCPGARQSEDLLETRPSEKLGGRFQEGIASDGARLLRAWTQTWILWSSTG
jgi:hypothetical protein